MRTGANNYAGALAPETSAYGRGWRASMGQLTLRPTPLVDSHYVNSYRGLIGVLLVRAARSSAVVAPRGYYGDLPQSEQPEVHTPDPWDVPL